MGIRSYGRVEKTGLEYSSVNGKLCNLDFENIFGKSKISITISTQYYNQFSSVCRKLCQKNLLSVLMASKKRKPNLIYSSVNEKLYKVYFGKIFRQSKISITKGTEY